MIELIKKYYVKMTKDILTDKGVEIPDNLDENSPIDEREFSFELDQNNPVNAQTIKSFLLMNPWCCLGHMPLVTLSKEKDKAAVTFWVVKGKGRYMEGLLVERFGVKANSDE